MGAKYESPESRARLIEDTATGVEIKAKVKPFTALQENTFLHSLSGTETYKLLVDSFACVKKTRNKAASQ
ncbi:hypothetical protein B0A48_05695 [Cryoendolithus antarcticus]|uniref:Uncharacterized protein n=1 Tax=Cryoendolithus antarcticus TaxID=1507870 RepID=A0A1V8TBQ3_9PEZI|nr:hypothetical protein B0A48_05695 [Cryoendolithus antarcticus]